MATEDNLEFIFLGTGTSSCIPHVHCLTNPPDGSQCRTCLSTLRPEGKKNIRRNTSAVMRMKADDGRLVTIVIDAGKSFQAAAVEWFPKYGLRKIDALLITHAHADAMNGLDDLRGWTLGGKIQNHIDIYVDQTTYEAIAQTFPYLVSKELASGGGDVPEFKWHIIENKAPFEIEGTGIQVTPLAVHHGRLFASPKTITLPPTPPPTKPSSPAPTMPSSPTSALHDLIINATTDKEIIRPFFCLAFKIRNDLIYMSDVSYIPTDIWPYLTTNVPVCVLDCLDLRKHSSHLAVDQSVSIARRIGARYTYLTGFSHDVAHEEHVTISEYVGGKAIDNMENLSENEQEGIKLMEDGDHIWIRPAHDGLRVHIGSEVYDDTYTSICI